MKFSGVADVQQAAGLPYCRVDAREHLALGRRVEIDHHVAAEHHIERLAEAGLQLALIRLNGRNWIELRELGLDADRGG